MHSRLVWRCQKSLRGPVFALEGKIENHPCGVAGVNTDQQGLYSKHWLCSGRVAPGLQDVQHHVNKSCG